MVLQVELLSAAKKVSFKEGRCPAFQDVPIFSNPQAAFSNLDESVLSKIWRDTLLRCPAKFVKDETIL